ncbi:hypothetical protein QR685DRAFT_577281 [Neurospora intermedia]|uniref:Uncharacterized protein n=1 Tax=Neurospora intermedia TaxID=5142 RepID=A0ABR3DQQ0_NEUIN
MGGCPVALYIHYGTKLRPALFAQIRADPYCHVSEQRHPQISRLEPTKHRHISLLGSLVDAFSRMQKLVTQTERLGLVSGMLSVEVKHYCPSHGLCLKDSVMSLTGLLATPACSAATASRPGLEDFNLATLSPRRPSRRPFGDAAHVALHDRREASMAPNATQ